MSDTAPVFAPPPEKQSEGASFIRIARVKEISGFSKSTLLRWISAGRFPAPVIHEGNSVLWDLAEVMSWRAAQFKKRDERGGVAANDGARA